MSEDLDRSLANIGRISDALRDTNRNNPFLAMANLYTEARRLRELLGHKCPECGCPVVGYSAAMRHCAPPTDDDVAEWQEHERRRLGCYY